jgi:predicted nucleotide-binding protein with TIR-like domain
MFPHMSTTDNAIQFGSAKPSVFIGSSTRGLPVARRLKELLARTARCRVWDRGVFGLGMGTLEALVKATRQYDFAILVLTPDDIASKKGVRLFLPRDNVVFELGLFMGTLGKDRTFILLQQQKDRIALPSDLNGITTAEFTGQDLRSASEKLREAIAREVSGINLTGQWYSSYQRLDPPIGKWVRDKTMVTAVPPQKLRFRNFDDPIGSKYEAVGELTGKNEIVGVWRETQEGATARGTFHLYTDWYGQKLYGVCTGPTSNGAHVYSGWVLVRDPNRLLEARRELRRANLVWSGSAEKVRYAKKLKP